MRLSHGDKAEEAGFKTLMVGRNKNTIIIQSLTDDGPIICGRVVEPAYYLGTLVSYEI